MKHTGSLRRSAFVLGLVFLGGLAASPAGNAQTVLPPVPASAASPLTGKIAHITILGSKNVPADSVRAVLVSRIGDAYNPQFVDKDRAAIQGMGVFSTFSVSASAAPGGVDVVYTVAEYPLVREIRFTANTPTGQPSVPAAVLIARMKTQAGQVLNVNVLTRDLAALFERGSGYVAQQGRLADVGTGLKIDPKTGIVTIPLVDYRIQSLEVTGLSRLPAAAILAHLHAKVGDLYDGRALSEDCSALYETGEFKEVKNFTWNVAAPGQVSIIIPVTEQEAAVGALDETRGKAIPFLYDPVTNPLPTVQVSINGQPALPFLVDTGSSPALSLAPWAAAQLGLTPTGPVGRGSGFTYRRTSIRSAVFQGKDHGGDAAFSLRDALIVDLSLLKDLPGPRLAGIVGLGMLGPLTTRFDFAAKTLTVFAYPHPPLHLLNGTVLPLRSNSMGALTARATLAADTFADLILDTGSMSTQVPLSALGVLRPTATAFNRGSQRAEGIYVSPELRLPGLTFRALRVPDVVADTVPDSVPPSLGLDILAGYRLTLDGPNGQATLEPSAAGGRYVSGWSGLDIKQSSGGWLVQGMQAGSPARRAGLQAGDQLVTVGGLAVQGLSWPQVKTLSAGVLSRPVRVTVRRGGSEKEFSWLPLDDFHAPATLGFGLTLTKAPGGPWVVVNVQTGCPGDRAGLRAGDRITRLGGEAVAAMPLERYAALAKQPSLRLEVERAGLAKPLQIGLSSP